MNNIFDWLYHKQTNNESQGSNVANNNIQTNTSMASSVGTNGLSYAKPQTTNTNDTKASVDVSQDKTQNNNFFSQLVGLVKEQFKNNQFTNENYNQEVKDKFNSIRAKQLSDKKEEEINNTLSGKDANNIFQYKDQEGNLYGFYDAKQTLEDFTSNIKNSENIIKALDDNIQSQYDSNSITRDSYNNYLTLREKEYNNLNNLINEANSYYEKLNNSTVEFVDHDIEIENLKNRNSEINKVLEEFDNKYSEEEMGIQMENQETLNWVNKLYEEENANNERIAQLEEYKLLQNDVVETNYYKQLQEYGTQEEIANYNEYLANEKNAWRNKKNFFDGAFGELMGASNMVVSAAYNMAGGFSQAIDFQIAKFDAQQPYIEQRNELIDKLNNGEITYNDYLNQISDIEKGLTITNDQVYNENSIGNRLVANAQKYNEYAMAGREGVDKFIMEAWGSSVPFLLSYLVAQPFAAATSLALGVDASSVVGAKTMANITKNFALSGMAITEYGNQVNDILSMQNEDGTYKYSVDVANLNALLHGATTFLVEQIGADAFADAITGEVGQYWFQRSISDLAKYGSRYLGQSMVNGALSEGAEEGIEKFVNLVVDSQTLGTIDSNNVGDYLNQLLGQWWEDGDIIHTLLVAGVSGGFTNLVGANQRIIEVQTKEDFNRLNSFAKKINVELTNKVNSEGISLIDKARIVEEQEAFNTIVDQALKGYNDKNVSSSFATITSNKNYDFEAIESIEGAIKESLGPDITKQIDQEVETKSLLDAKIYEFNTLIDRTLINNGIYYGVVGNEERNIFDEQGAYVEDTKFYALGKEAREQMMEAAKIINEMGVNDYSFAILRSKKDGQIIDGTNVNGKIIINPICIKGDLSTYIHELYHRLENKGLSSIVEKEVVDTLKEDFKNQYKTLSEEEKSNFKDANDFVEKMYEFLIQNKINEYKQGNINLNRQAAISEVITEQIQNKLGNKNFIDSLIKSNESMAYRLYSSIKANLSGDSWKKIANEYEKAFRNLITNGQIDIRSDLAYSIVGKELENNTKDAYVEDTRTPDLVAIHNLSEDNLLKSIELGGFIMPSIAVTKSNISHDGFGDISLLFDKSTIDPSIKGNKVYKRDAWTPTFPRIENEIKKDKVRELHDYFYGLSKKVDERYSQDLRNVMNEYTNANASDNDVETLVKKYKDSPSLKAAYLEEQGKHIDVEKGEESVYTPSQEKLYESILELIPSFNYTEEQLKEMYGDQIAKISYEYDIANGKDEEMAKKRSTSNLMFNRLLDRALDYRYKKENNQTTRTVYKLNEANKKIADLVNQQEYEQWLNDLFDGLFGEKAIWNGKSAYTDSGNLRTFKQQYMPATKENILKKMLSMKETGGDWDLVHQITGFNAIAGMMGGEFKNIDEIIQRENIVGDANSEVNKANYDALNKEYYAIMNDLLDFYKFDSRKNVDSRIAAEDSIGYALRELKGKKMNASNVKNAFANNNYDIDDSMTNRIVALFDNVANMVTNYFEAKPRRIVGIDEVERAIIPINSSDKLVKALNDNNISYLMYDPSIEDSRSGIVDAQDDLKFSYVSNKGLDNIMKDYYNQPSEVKEFLKKASNNYVQAEKMVKSNASPRDIFINTGFVLGKDGRLRYEIIDDLDYASKNYNLNGDKYYLNKKEGQYDIKDFINPNSLLYKMYPELNSTKVIINLKPNGDSRGEYDTKTGNITLFEKSEPTTIFHELQHKIQVMEKMDHGTSPDYEKSHSLLDNKFWEYFYDYDNNKSFLKSLNEFSLYRYFYNAGEYESKDVERRAKFRTLNMMPGLISDNYENNVKKYYDDGRGFSYEKNNKKSNNLFSTKAHDIQGLTSNTSFSFAQQYNEAIQNNDIQKAQEIVNKVAKANGFNIEGYHGSYAEDITSFNPKNSESQFGKYKFNDINVTYITKEKDVAKGYTKFGYDNGKNIYHVYAKLENPFVIDSNEEYSSWKSIKNSNIQELHKNLVDEFKSNWEVIDDENISDYFNEINNDLNSIGYELVKNNNGNYDIYELNNNTMFGGNKKSYELDKIGDIFDYGNIYEFEDDYFDEDITYTTDDIVRFVLNLRNNGEFYDGIIFNNIYDVGPHGDLFSPKTNDIVVFGDGNNIKSADAITYDDNGTIIPLEQRFNEGNGDIRFAYNPNKPSYTSQTYDKVTTPEIKEAIDKKEMDIAMDVMGLNDLLEQMQNDPNNQASLNKTIDEMSQNIAKPKEVKGAKDGETIIDSEFKNEKQLKPTNEVIKKLAKDYTNKGKYIWDISRKVKDDNIYTLYNQYLNSSRQATYMMNKQGGFNEILNEIPKDLQEDFSYMVYHGVNIDAAKYGKNVFSDFTSEQSQQIFNQYMLEHPSWKSTYEKVLAYENNLTNILLDNGMINRSTYDKWMEMYPHYVHVSRILEQEESDLQKPKVNSSNKAIKGRTGGKQDIKPLGTAVDEHTLNVFRSINMNEFAKEYSNVAGTKKTNWKDISIDQITGGDLPQSGISLNAMLKAADKNTPATLIYYNNGEMNLMEIPNELYDVFQTKREDNVLTNSLQYMNNIRRNLLTGWNPLFMVTNPIKDVQDVLYKSEHPFATYTKMPKAMLGLLLDGSKTNSNNVNLNNLRDLANSWHSLGGGLNGIVEVNSKSKLYNNTIGKIERINNYIESVPRFAEFLASIDKGRTMTQAMYDSDKVTTNFKMGGEKTKAWDRNGATFLNASVEGLTELVQAYERTYDKNGVKGVIGKMALATFVYNVPLMLLNHLVWGDDDDYEDLSDYIKDNYYIVGKTQDGRFIRIPKGRIAAAYQSVLQSIWDNGVELVSDDSAKEKAINMWENSLDGIKGVVDNIGVNNPLTNNIASPLVNAAMNRTWYGEDIVSDSLAKKDNALQYDYTTDEISKWIGENLNLSPKKINYILDQYSGGVGDVVLPMLTPNSETGLDDGTIGGKVASALLSPVVDKFSSDYVFKNQNVSDIYNLKDELTKKASKENANDEIKLSSNYINSITSQMNKLYGERRDIFNDSTLNDNEKYRQARMVQEQINALAKEGLATYDQLDIVGAYSEVNGYGFLKQDDGSWKKVDNDVNSELDSLGMNTNQKSEYFNMKDTFTSNNRINTLQGYYQDLEEIQNSNYSETMKNTKLADINSKIVSLKEKMSDSEIAQANGDYDNKAANFETLLNSSLTSEQKNYTYNKYFDSNLNGYIDELDASDEDKMYIKYLASTQTSDKDANGKTIEHSKAKKIAQVYEEYGVLDQVLNYISEYDIEPSVFGLNKTVYTNLKKGYSIGNSGASTKTSTKYFNEDGTLTSSGLKKIASLLNSSNKSSDVSSIVKEFVNKAKQTYDIPTTYEDVKSQFEKKYGKMI